MRKGPESAAVHTDDEGNLLPSELHEAANVSKLTEDADKVEETEEAEAVESADKVEESEEAEAVESAAKLFARFATLPPHVGPTACGDKRDDEEYTLDAAGLRHVLCAIGHGVPNSVPLRPLLAEFGHQIVAADDGASGGDSLWRLSRAQFDRCHAALDTGATGATAPVATAVEEESWTRKHDNGGRSAEGSSRGSPVLATVLVIVVALLASVGVPAVRSEQMSAARSIFERFEGIVGPSRARHDTSVLCLQV